MTSSLDGKMTSFIEILIAPELLETKQNKQKKLKTQSIPSHTHTHIFNSQNSSLYSYSLISHRALIGIFKEEYSQGTFFKAITGNCSHSKGCSNLPPKTNEISKALVLSYLLIPGQVYLVLHITTGKSKKTGEMSQGILGSTETVTFTRYISS